MKGYQVLAYFIIASNSIFSQPFGYEYGKQIIIDAAQVPGTTDLSNFPVLIKLTDPDLRTASNGGKVRSASGYDIRFTGIDCTSYLDHQLESYNPATGELIAWVRIPTLGATANTPIHMYYGNADITSSTSVTSAWNSNYFAVYHFDNSVSDGTAYGNHLTNVNATSLSSSVIGAGIDLDNSTNVLCSVTTGKHLVMPNGVFSGVSDFTWSGWVYLDRDGTNWERIFDFGQSTAINFFFTPSTNTNSPSQTRARITTGGNGTEQGPVIANPVANTGSWIYWAVTVNNGTNTLSIYKNGVLFGTASSVTLIPNNMGVSTNNYFGRSQYAVDHYIDAKFDEFRLSKTVHSADWIATEYNNQSSPSTFYSVSSEFNSSGLCVVLPVGLLNFNAALTQNNEVAISWTTDSEVNSDYFTVERSSDALNWEKILTLDGAGNSLSLLNYSATDADPMPGLSYYRLKQTDFNGYFFYSEIKSVDLGTDQAELYPNPASYLITLKTDKTEMNPVSIYDVLGQDITQQTDQIVEETSLVIDISRLTSGIYYVKTNSTTRKFYKS